MVNLCKVILTLIIPIALATVASAKPDLLVSRVFITRDKGGIFVEKISVTIMNSCRDTAGVSYVLITFKENERENAKSIYYTGNSVRSLKGGESHTRTFDVSERKIVFGRHVMIEVDPYKKVAEASEDNNWRTQFPDGIAATVDQAQCTG